MAITTAIAVYFLIWWVVLFAVLPWGIRAQDAVDAPAGTDPGAPAVPRLVAKLVWTTLVSAVVYVVCAIIYKYRIITLDDLAALLGSPR
jgi:predicted secreted protein